MIYFGYPLDIHGNQNLKPNPNPNLKTVGEKPIPNPKPADTRTESDLLPSLQETPPDRRYTSPTERYIILRCLTLMILGYLYNPGACWCRVSPERANTTTVMSGIEFKQ